MWPSCSCIRTAWELVLPLSITVGSGAACRSGFQMTEGSLPSCHGASKPCMGLPYISNSLKLPQFCSVGTIILIVPSRKFKFKESEAIHSKPCSFLHSLNNHLSNVHCVPGSRIVTVPDTVGSGVVRIHPRTGHDTMCSLAELWW